jgi:hypothetical protein
MDRPLLVAVRWDPHRFGLLERELRKRYAVDYEVVCLRSADAVVTLLDQARTEGREVALVLGDIRLRVKSRDRLSAAGQLMAEARARHPTAVCAGLVAWSDPEGGGEELLR